MSDVREMVMWKVGFANPILDLLFASESLWSGC